MSVTMKSQAAYDELIRCAREESLLASCTALLGWDEQTYMPKGGVQHRGDQMALLAGMHHEKATHPHIGALLAELEGSQELGEPDSSIAVNVRELRRNYNRLTRLPRSLVEEIARVTSVAQQEWIVARQRNDFAHFRPWLEQIVALKREEAERLEPDDALYDALLDEHEPGARTREIAVVFEALRKELVPLIEAIANSPVQPDVTILHRAYPIDRQRRFGEAVAAAVGFDFERGRLDITAHPFCTKVGPGDCRITTRFSLHDFSEAFFGILHEVGHGLYEQGLAPEHYGTPMGDAVSLGVHESQSRLWENVVGRSRAFWSHFHPVAQQTFHESLHDVSLDAFHFAVNRVERGTNRVRADEVTYNLHILLRFELEQALLNDDLRAADLPGAWNEKYRQYLGVEPKNDSEGCMQDIHWSAGLIGYFPTYTLGNLFAAQLFAKACDDLGDPNEPFARGDFAGLLGWLRDKVHRQGHRYSSSELIEQVTGAPPDHRPLLQFLRHKYGALYRI